MSQLDDDVAELRRRILAMPRIVVEPCDGNHRGPQGPNEDLGQCPYCWDISYRMRPPGSTYGEHLDDCSLPVDHESYCLPGGSGHPPSEHVRGFFLPAEPDVTE